MRYAQLLRTLATNAKRARLAALRSQEDVAHAASMTVRAYSSIERGQTPNPSLTSIHAIANAVGLEVAELLTPGAVEAEPAPLKRGRKPKVRAARRRTE